MSDVRPDKRAMLAKLMEQKAAATAGPQPLAIAQERLWFLEQLEPGTALYSIPMTVRLQGALQMGALEKALNEIIRRHSALRTTFGVDEKGRPYQQAQEFQPITLPVIDLRDLPPEARETEACRLAAAEGQRPFDLSSGPLVRFTLLRLSDTEHWLQLNMHHIISDGWSLEVIFRELAALYGGSPLPPLTISYAAAARRQREQHEAGALEPHLDYWKEKLGGKLPVLGLPTDRPRGATLSYRGDTVTAVLPRDLAEAWKALCRREGVTPFMGLLAAFDVLLHRYSRQDDIIVGTPVAGRPSGDVEGLVGFFANTLVLRTDLAGRPAFRDLLKRVKETVLEGYAHQEVPFAKLVEVLHPDRFMGGSPLFQVMFSLENVGELRLPGLQAREVRLRTGTAKFDLSVFAREEDGGWTCEWEFKTDLFEAETIRRMGVHFETLLRAMVANPNQAIDALPMLPEDERRLVLDGFNQTAEAYPEALGVHQLVAAQAGRTPDRVAVVCGAVTLTYAELDRRSNQLARYLARLGVGPDEMVGIAADRSVEMIVAMLAVLKAGGAYVPMDPGYPRERLAYMLSDTAARVVLTHERLRAALPVDGGARLVCLDTDWAEISLESDEPLVSRSGPENLSYVIYTSGSTGKPKGVQLTHRGLTDVVTWMVRKHNFSADDIMLAETSISFDIAETEVYLPLTTGGKLVVADRAAAADGAALTAMIREQGITFMQGTPATYRILLASGWQSHPGLTMIVGGEPLPRELADRIIAGGGTLWDQYGPTETTIWSTWWKVAPAGPIVIGRPVANTRVYLLDDHLQPVPVGVPGELYIGGENLARGYLNRPDLTAERFLNTPYGRIYKTGDLARFLPDGEIEYLGRLDHQVKIRGYRIELGEIESVLAQHPAVAQAVVVAREDGTGEYALVAYYILKAGQAVTVNELRAALRVQLPEFMVPSVFMVLERMPLTGSGKVDRKALPEPEGLRPDLEVAYVPPATDLQRTVAAIWQDVLRIEKAGLNDNFFDLGGHSLSATRVAYGIKEQLGADLPLKALFEAPTLGAMAAEVETALALGKKSNGTAPALVEAAVSGPQPLAVAQERLWFLDKLEPGTALYAMPITLRFRGALNVGALEQALNEIVRRQATLRTTFAMDDDGQPYMEAAEFAPFALPVISLEDRAVAEREAEARRLLAAEGERPFDLQNGPAARFTLLRLSEDEHWLHIAIHHINADGWSLDVIANEIKTLYGGSPLPDLPLSYAAFARRQREEHRRGALEPHLGYWKQKLGGSLPVLELPTDRPRPANPSYHGNTLTTFVPKDLADAWKALCRREGVTPFMALLAAFEVLLHRYSRQEDIAVGTPVAGRASGDVEGLVGLFVNTLVLRTDLSGRPAFRNLLKRVRETALEAFAHQEMPFSRLVEELHPDRFLGSSPLFQVMFTVTGAPAAPSIPGLQVSRIDLPTGTAKFDLSVQLADENGGWACEWEYRTDLFDAATIERMGTHFESLLRVIAAAPDQPIDDLPMLPDSERQLVLERFNQTATEYPSGFCIHQLFEAQAANTPDKVAVVCGDQQLTYAELDRRSNQLARYLARFNVRPDELVGIAADRSPETIVAMLAVLKAGGAYAPLDPSYPRERLAYMLSDTAARVVLTHERLRSALPVDGGARLVCLDTDWAEISRESDAPVGNVATPENLSYVIYTSGSTGRPKGVLTPHRAVVRLVRNNRFADLTAGDVFLQLAPVSFDASTLEVWGALLNGARLVIMPDQQPTLDELAQVLTEQHVSVLWLTAGLFHLMVEHQLEALLQVRQVLAGGDVLSVSHVKRMLAALKPGHRLINGYGPTENTTFTCCFPMTGETQISGSVPVGRPIANTQCYVLDRSLKPVPVGVPGELYAGGDGLARGYLNRPDLTAERFVASPYGRLYRTGDLVRWLPDGNIEFLGRNDDQVKIRGFRIELGEIETALAAHPAVEGVVVLAREDGGAGKRLVAYLTTHQEPAASDFRAYLKERLPEYMIPSAFVVLPEFPLNPNGKVDRRALPAPELQAGRSFEPPQTDVEQKLAAIWIEVLAVPRVGLADDFFELGGHSLNAIRVVHRVREQIGADLPVRVLFEAPQLGALAARVAEVLTAPAAPAGMPFDPLLLDADSARLWLDRVDELTDDQIDILLGVIEAKEGAGR